MAVALQQQPVESAAEIIAALAGARNRPSTALRSAAEHADEVARAVIDVIEQARRGVFLMPGQENLLFWGIHAVAAARRTELYRPLLALVPQLRRLEAVSLIEAAIRRTLKKMVVSTFDGDPGPLIAACADPALDGDLRSYLMLALARLTFDGRVPRETTLAFLNRFERERLAGPDDPAWDGWQDIIAYLGLEEMRERLRITWMDGRNPLPQEERDRLERLISIARGLAPGDDALLEGEDIVPLRDPVDDLEWTTLLQYRRSEDGPDRSDPAGACALKGFEIEWLKAFLVSSKVPPATMMLEEVDGFFCALIAGPPGARIDSDPRAIWNADPEGRDAPSYDGPEQQQYVQALLRRHWTTIAQRLEGSYPHQPLFISRVGPWRARDWARAFVRGMAVREAEWDRRIDEQGSIGIMAQVVLRLTLNRGEANAARLTPQFREQLVAALPRGLVALHHAWRGREHPLPPTPRAAPARKVGRNEPCPCGSGKKHKRCCGAPEKRA